MSLFPTKCVDCLAVSMIHRVGGICTGIGGYTDLVLLSPYAAIAFGRCLFSDSLARIPEQPLVLVCLGQFETYGSPSDQPALARVARSVQSRYGSLGKIP